MLIWGESSYIEFIISKLPSPPEPSTTPSNNKQSDKNKITQIHI